MGPGSEAGATESISYIRQVRFQLSGTAVGSCQSIPVDTNLFDLKLVIVLKAPSSLINATRSRQGWAPEDVGILHEVIKEKMLTEEQTENGNI